MQSSNFREANRYMAVNRLTLTYVAALMAIAVTAVVGQVVIQTTLNSARSDAHSINIAGRQRMLSEKIVKTGLLLRSEEPSEGDATDKVEILRQSLSQLRRTHRALKYGDDELGVYPVKAPAIKSLLNELDPIYQSFYASAKSFADRNGTSDQKQISDLVRYQSDFLPVMNEVVARMSTDASERIRRSSNMEYGLLFVTLAVLLLEAFFVFRPTVDSVRRSFAMVKEREKSLLESERRHRDLFLYSAGPLLCLHPETGRIISANPAAAEELGATREQLSGKRFTSFLSAESTGSFDDCLGKLEKGPQLETHLSVETDTIKQEWASMCTMYRSETEEPYVLLSAHNVTQLHERELELIESTRRDGLTGMYCRAEFDLRIEEVSAVQQAIGTPFSLAMIDIDDFKQFNDNHGHQTGDRVLREVAKIIQQHCRDADVVARYGGEEIAVIFPSLDSLEAEKVVERMRVSIAAFRFEVGGDAQSANPHASQILSITISAGVACSPKHAIATKGLIRAADDAMYAAKASGKNAVCVYKSNLLENAHAIPANPISIDLGSQSDSLGSNLPSDV